MNQTHSIHATLKKLMRSQGRTYADAAGVLNLSEASIKRLFSQHALSLSRLESICNWLHVDIHDLVKMSREQEPLTTELSEEQEAEFLEDAGRQVETAVAEYQSVSELSIESMFDYMYGDIPADLEAQRDRAKEELK